MTNFDFVLKMGKIKSKSLISNAYLDVAIDNLSFQPKDDDINYNEVNRTVITIKNKHSNKIKL